MTWKIALIIKAALYTRFSRYWERKNEHFNQCLCCWWERESGVEGSIINHHYRRKISILVGREWQNRIEWKGGDTAADRYGIPSLEHFVRYNEKIEEYEFNDSSLYTKIYHGTMIPVMETKCVRNRRRKSEYYELQSLLLLWLASLLSIKCHLEKSYGFTYYNNLMRCGGLKRSVGLKRVLVKASVWSLFGGKPHTIQT